MNAHTPDQLARIAKLENEVDELFKQIQQREPLTDEELDTLRQGQNNLNFVTLREFRVIARAIENAHGIGS